MLGTTTRAVAVLVAFALFTTSCANTMQGMGEDASSMGSTMSNNPKATLGALGGAGGGALIAGLAGANPAWIVGSALMGGLLGGYIGHKMDEKDKRMAAQAAAQAFENNRSGQKSVWNNPESGQPRRDRSREDVSDRQRPVLPALRADHLHRRRAPAEHRHRLPPARRLLADPELRRGRLVARKGVSPMRIALRRLPFTIIALAVATSAVAAEKAPSYEPKQAFEEADGNQDGVVDQPELYARFTEVFFFNDKDKDGFLDVTEYQATRAQSGGFEKGRYRP